MKYLPTQANAMDGQVAGVAAVTAAVTATLYILFGFSDKKKKRSSTNLSPGLYNLGNTCFMNSALQGIASLPSFVTWLERFGSATESEKVIRLGEELWKLLKALTGHCAECQHEVLDPGIILAALQSHHWVITSQQQDAHEFYQVLSSTLDEEMGELPSVLNLSDIAAVEDVSKPEDSTVAHRDKVPQPRHCNKAHIPFRGLLASQLVCKKCHTKCPVKFDGFDSLSLSLPTNLQVSLTLEHLLHKFVCSETVDSVDCKGCSGTINSNSSANKSRFIKRLTLGKLPQCLCIHIQRTYWHSNGIPYKNNTFIKFPEYLNLGPFMYEPLIPRSMKKRAVASMNHFNTSGVHLPKVDAGEACPLFVNHAVDSAWQHSSADISSRTVFKLMSLITHQGDVDDGHYVTYRRLGSSGGWVCASDELVEQVSRDRVFKSCAYMLFYERET